MSDEIALVPYAQVNGVWTIPTADVLEFAGKAHDEGLFRIFYDGSIEDPLGFLEAMQQPANVPVFVFQGTRMFGCGWLNGCNLNRAFAHVLCVKDGWGLAEHAGRLAIDYWFSFMVDDEPLFDVLLGLIPTDNRLAISFAKRIGFEEVGPIPKMIRRQGATHPATVLYRVR